jgi:peptide deformylase
MTARAILHELDHLNGMVYTKRANQIHLQRAMNKKKQLDRQQARALKQAI